MRMIQPYFWGSPYKLAVHEVYTILTNFPHSFPQQVWPNCDGPSVSQRDALRHLQKVLPGLTVLVIPLLLLCCLDELCQSKVETHISFAWQQQKWAGPFQAPQDEWVDVAPSSFPSGWLASVQLPRHSQLRHLHPSSASAVEPRGLCCILATELISGCYCHRLLSVQF